MTRAEETARVAALRAAFAADPEPCPFRWFARQQDQQSAAEPAREREPDPLLQAFAPWDDDAWHSIADTEKL